MKTSALGGSTMRDKTRASSIKQHQINAISVAGGLTFNAAKAAFAFSRHVLRHVFLACAGCVGIAFVVVFAHFCIGFACADIWRLAGSLLDFCTRTHQLFSFRSAGNRAASRS